MAIEIREPWWHGGDGIFYADTCHEHDRPKESKVLGPDGKPLRYEPRQTVGFDLQPSARRDRDA